VLLLQSLSTPAPAEPAPRPALPPGLDADLCLRVARLVARHPGPLAADLVLPWAVTLPSPPSPSPASGGLERARALAAALTRHSWGDPSRAAAALAALRGLEPGATDLLGAARAADPVEGGTVLGLLARLPDPPSRPHPWGPFLFAVISAAGRAAPGTPAAPGAGAGPAHVHDPDAPGPLPPGAVLVAGRPLPGLAALLWNASGLVTVGGSPGAHLIEVARSLGVPAVTGCRLDALLAGPALLAVDGDTGTVTALRS
jgi:phosphohistidine swiveling domain-containing protein